MLRTIVMAAAAIRAALGDMRIQIRRQLFLSRNRLSRFFWLLMLATHSPGLVRFLRTALDGEPVAEHVIGLALRTLILSFFVLKVLDVTFLKWRIDRRSFVAWCLVIAMLHVEVLHASDFPPLLSEYTTLVAVTFLAVGAKEIRRDLVLAVKRALPMRLEVAWRSPSHHTVWQSGIRHARWLPVLYSLRLRAPPC